MFPFLLASAAVFAVLGLAVALIVVNARLEQKRVDGMQRAAREKSPLRCRSQRRRHVGAAGRYVVQTIPGGRVLFWLA